MEAGAIVILLVVTSPVILTENISKRSLYFGVYVSKRLRCLTHLSQNLQAVMMLAEVKALLSLTNAAEKLSVLLAVKSLPCILKKINGTFDVGYLA